MDKEINILKRAMKKQLPKINILSELLEKIRKMGEFPKQ